LTDEQNVPLTELALMVALARMDSPEGYQAFYALIQGFPPRDTPPPGLRTSSRPSGRGRD